ncbi:hypothetical protein CapIbe_018106 [Capra ibex]
MSSKNCSQLDQLKAALNEKRQALVNRKHIIFHQAKDKNVLKSARAQKAEALGLAAPEGPEAEARVEGRGGRTLGEEPGRGAVWARLRGSGEPGRPKIAPLAQVGPTPQRPNPRRCSPSP